MQPDFENDSAGVTLSQDPHCPNMEPCDWGMQRQRDDMTEENGMNEEATQEKQVINFNINDARIAKAAEEFKDIDAYKDLVTAKRAKKVLVTMRSTLAEAHKDQKAESLAYGRRLDHEKNRLLDLIAPIEDPISTQLTDIKEADARKEQARIDAIEEKIESIRAYGHELEDLTVIDLQKIQDRLASIVILEDDYMEFCAQAEGAISEAESRLRIAINKAQAREEEEARLEQVRKDQEARQAELDEQQRKMDAQAETLRKDREERDRIEQEKQAKENAERQAALDKQAEEQRAEQDKIDAENKRIANEQEAERKEAERVAAADRAAELAPDRDKLEALATALDNFPMPDVKSKQAGDVLTYVRSELKSIKTNIIYYAKEME